MGWCPDWYGIIRSAKYLGVAPWELVDQPICWQQWAAEAESAENQARRQQAERDARRARRRR